MWKSTILALYCVLLFTLQSCAQWFALPTAVLAPKTAEPSHKSTASTGKPTHTPAKTKAAAPSPTPKPTQSPTEIAGPVTVAPETFTVTCEEYLTLRYAPSVEAQALMRVNKGAKVKVDGYEGAFAHATDAGGNAGYLLAGYLVPDKKDKWLTGLDVVKPVEKYSYDQMMKDLTKLASLYPKKLRLESAGKTAQGRDIPVAVLGDPDAPHQVFFQGSIHAREHMASLLMMAQLEYCLKFGDAPAGAGTVAKALDGVCLRFLPMSNPDGVEISQKAVMTDALRSIYTQDKKRGLASPDQTAYLQTWKANALGVDINRNFPAGWDALETSDGPSSSRYRGAEPGDQNETKALMDYTKKRRFDATISYHATGGFIYWQYGGNTEVNRLSYSLAGEVRACTGYTVLGADGLDAGGYKDWAMDALGIPSLTVEVGSRECPLPLDEFYTTWERNRNVPAAVAEWVKNN